jgi:hypothetical protein
MARGGGSGSGMMIMVILILLLFSSALAGGGYFYMNQEDSEKEAEDEFKLKYQEAARALEAERAAQQNVNVAKSALELAQEELEMARLAFEGKEFANEAEKSAARARLYAAEQDVDTAAFRLSEAETDARTAETRRDTAEQNANSALEIAITINTMIEANAVADANVMVTLAQGELDAAQRDWERIIGDANAAAANVIIAADAEAYAAYSRFLVAQNNLSTASTNLETVELELSAAEAREATALIGAAEKLAVSIGAGVSVRCSANDVGEGAGAVYRVDGETNVLRHYPSAEIAASWDPNYASAQSIDCIGFVLSENDMVKNPAVVAAEAAAALEAELATKIRAYTATNLSSANYLHMNTNVESLPATAPSWNDQISSIYVPTGNWVQVFTDTGYVGTSRVFGPGTHNMEDVVNNKISSYKVGTGTPPTAHLEIVPDNYYTMIGGRNNKFCSDTPDGIACNRDSAFGHWETFQLVRTGTDKFGLKGGRFGRYCADTPDGIACNRDNIYGPWEQFQLEKTGVDKYALKGGRNNKYCADEGDIIKCDRDNIYGDWEQFSISNAPIGNENMMIQENNKIKGFVHGDLLGEGLTMSQNTDYVGGTWNDKISSVIVPPGKWIQMFDNANYTGASRVFGPGTHNYVGDGINDRMSSYKVGTGTPPSNTGSSSGGGGGGGGQPADVGPIYGPSDPKLKDNIKKIGTYEGLNVYEWTWNDIAMTTHGLKGREVGFLTTELDPEYVGKDQYGYEYIKDGTKISEAVKTVRATMK